MKRDYTNAPILITGAYRTGKTLIAEVIRDCGVFAGDFTAGLMDGKNGHEVLISHLKDAQSRLLAQDGGGYPSPLPSIQMFWNQIITERLHQWGYNPTNKWMLKSPSILPQWELWAQSFPEAKVVVVARSREDILRSLAHTYPYSQNSQEEWERVLDTCEDYQVKMIKSGMNVKVIWPERCVGGDYRAIHDMLNWLGLEWHSESLMRLDRKFKKVRKHL